MWQIILGLIKANPGNVMAALIKIYLVISDWIEQKEAVKRARQEREAERNRERERMPGQVNDGADDVKDAYDGVDDILNPPPKP